MKKIILGLAVLMTFHGAIAQSNSNFANVNKPVICAPVESIFKGLADKDINEKPAWTGKREDLKTDFYVFINFETSAFTIVETGKEIGCILGIGYKSNFFRPPPTDSIKSKISSSLHD